MYTLITWETENSMAGVREEMTLEQAYKLGFPWRFL